VFIFVISRTGCLSVYIFVFLGIANPDNSVWWHCSHRSWCQQK